MKAESGLDFPCFHQDSAALIKKHLTPEIYSALKSLSTASGYTLDMAVRSGVVNADSSIGIYTGDSQSYTLFSKILDPIIRDYHGLEKEPDHKPEMRPLSLAPLDREGRFIKSLRIRVARNLDAFPFCSNMRFKDRTDLASEVQEALASLPEALTGRYVSYSDLSPEALSDLVEKKIGFPKGDRFQEAAGINRYFPHGRGAFSSHDQRFRVWVNEEDHLRIMAVDKTSDMAGVFACLLQGLEHLEKRLNFSFDPGLGFLNTCPTNIGTAMRAGVHICLPKLNQHQDQLKELVKAHHLQVRGTMGEKTAVENALFDISNARRLGVSANEILIGLHQGLADIIHTEKNL